MGYNLESPHVARILAKHGLTDRVTDVRGLTYSGMVWPHVDKESTRKDQGLALAVLK